MRLRSLLFVPANDTRKLAKASTLDADALVLDWEDGVAEDDKDAARRGAIEFLRDRKRHLTLIRVNPVGSAAFRSDLLAFADGVPDGCMLSKCQSADEVEALAKELDRLDPGGRCAIFPLVESARGLLNACSILSASARVHGLCFGAEDFAGDAGITCTEGESELLYARSALVIACRAASREAIDSPCLHFRDAARTLADGRRAKNLGFTGKLAIHPAQVPLLNTLFSPSPIEIDEARSILSAFQAAGGRVTSAGGRMIDEAVVKRARRVLESGNET